MSEKISARINRFPRRTKAEPPFEKAVLAGNRFISAHERPPALEGEILDSEQISRAELARVLSQLDRINSLSNVPRKLWLEAKPRLRREKRVTFLDIACGSGANLRKLVALARHDGFSASGIGIDRNPECIAYAKRQSGFETSFLVGDAMNPPALAPCTVVFSTLFLHHLPTEQAPLLLKEMQRFSSGICLVHDLVRSVPGALMLRLFFSIFRPSPIVRKDGIISIRQAFRLDEVKEICRAAGIREYTLKRSFPLKFMLRWGGA